jgi:hypothetical protein
MEVMKMPVKSLLFATAILLLANVSSATVHYVTKSGNDNYAGTTWDSAWASIDKLNRNMHHGDTALFGTGIWYNSQIIPPSGEGYTDTTWTIYACSTYVYNNSNEEKLAGCCLPKIFGGELITQWHDTTVNGHNMYYAYWTGSNCYNDGGADGAQVYTLSQRDSLVRPRVSLSDVDSEGEFFHDVTASGLIFSIFYGYQNPNNFTTIASCKPVVDMRGDFDHVKFWGLDLEYGKHAVAMLSPYCDTISFEHCHLARTAHRDHENPAVVFSGQSNYKSGEGIRIIACSLGWALNEGSEYGHGGIIEMYSQEHALVESCYVYGYGSMGICWKNYPNNAFGPYTGNVIRFNTIMANGKGVHIETDPDRDSVYGNFIIGFDTTAGVAFEISSTGPLSSGYVGKSYVCNNTFYRWKDRFMRMAGAAANGCGSGNEVKYNIFYEYVDNNHYESPPYFIGFDYAPTGCEAAFTIDSNCYYDPQAPFDCNCQSPEGIAGWYHWTHDCGFDTHGVNRDPGLNVYDLSRTIPQDSVEMDRYYGGRHWSLWGAWQPDNSSDPFIGVSPADLQFEMVEGENNPGSRTLNIYNNGGGTMSWSLSKHSSWLLISPTSGTNGGQVVVSVDGTGLAAGIYNDTITVSAPGAVNSPRFVPVSFTIFEPAPNTDNIAYGIAPLVSSSDGGYNPSMITDGILDPYGNETTTWKSSESSTQPHWVTIDFGSAKSLKYVKLFWAYDSGQSLWMRPREYHIQRWNGSAYVDIATVRLDTAVAIAYPDTVFDSLGNIAYINVAGPEIDSNFTITEFPLEIQTSRIRIYQPVNMGPESHSTALWLSELEIYYIDVCPPEPIGTLQVFPGFDWGEVYLTWTAPGDDNETGRAARYDIKFSEHFINPDNWDSLPSYDDSPIPLPSGNLQVLFLDETLDPDVEYFFAIRAFDESDNESSLSNVCLTKPSLGGMIQQTQDSGFALAGPANQAVLNSVKPWLTVFNISDSATNMYFFEVAYDPDFFNIALLSGPIAQQEGDITAWRITENLNAGSKYFWRARANSSDFLGPRSFSVRPLPHPYPNPFDLSYSNEVTFTAVPEGANLMIMTISGSTVKYLKNIRGGEITWDGRNESNNLIASGTYLWYIEGTDLNGKLVVIR